MLLLLLRVREAFCPRRRPHGGPIELQPVRHETTTSLHYNTILLMLELDLQIIVGSEQLRDLISIT